MDSIASESGIGKMTLYRHYPSKDELIVAFLRQSDRDFWDYFEQSTGKAAGARAKLLAFFRSLQGYVTSPTCYGCPFLNMASEYPLAAHPGHRVALEHKRAVRARFRKLAAGCGRAPAAGAGRRPAAADGRGLPGRADVRGCARQPGRRRG